MASYTLKSISFADPSQSVNISDGVTTTIKSKYQGTTINDSKLSGSGTVPMQIITFIEGQESGSKVLGLSYTT